MNELKSRPDSNFWAFVYLILSRPDMYLSKEGQIVLKIVENEGKFDTVNSMTKSLEEDPGEFMKKYGWMFDVDHLSMTPSSTMSRKIVTISDNIVQKSEELLEEVFKR